MSTNTQNESDPGVSDSPPTYLNAVRDGLSMMELPKYDNQRAPPYENIQDNSIVSVTRWIEEYNPLTGITPRFFRFDHTDFEDTLSQTMTQEAYSRIIQQVNNLLFGMYPVQRIKTVSSGFACCMGFILFFLIKYMHKVMLLPVDGVIFLVLFLSGTSASYSIAAWIQVEKEWRTRERVTSNYLNSIPGSLKWSIKRQTLRLVPSYSIEKRYWILEIVSSEDVIRNEPRI